MDKKTPSAETVRKDARRRCMFCGQVADLIWVHGHGQCAACGINAEACCSGETCQKPE